MQVEARVTRQPGFDLGVLVGGIVVDDEVQLDPDGRLLLDVLQKAQPLAVGVAPVGAGNDFALQVVQGGKERHGAVPAVIVRLRRKVTGLEWQTGLGALEGLNLAFQSRNRAPGLDREAPGTSRSRPKI